MPIVDNVLQLIGRTPVVRINALSPQGRTMFAKMESVNPGSSVKDRLALAVMQDALNKGILKKGQVVVEATSGNTGISLAMVCGVLGHPFVSVMGDNFSVERRRLMRLAGARVVLTPAAGGGQAMVDLAKELAEKKGWFLPSQFDNQANPDYHANTTGPEILQDFADQRLDYWVTGWGTGGTVLGAGRTIKAARPSVKIVLVEPEDAPMVSKNEWASHKIQGWAPNFVPGTFANNDRVYDQVSLCSNDEAISAARELAAKEGLFVGISSGATFAAARRVAEEAPEGSVVLAMLPDTCERYMSTPLFEGIAADSSDSIDDL